MNKSTYLFKVLFALVLTIVFVRCQDEPIETAPAPAAPAELVQKSGKIGSLDISTQLRLAIENMAESKLQAATGYLDKIYLERMNGEMVLIWDSLEYFDFLDLEAGIGRDIGIVPIPPGVYKAAHCRIQSAEVRYKGKTYDCVVPGGFMILEFVEPAEVTYHLSPEFIITIDVSKSFFPIYSRVVYREYIRYVMKQRRRNKRFISFDQYRNREKPVSFIMNPNLVALNQTVTGSAAGYLGAFALGGAPAFGVTLSLWDDNGQVINEFGGVAAAQPFEEFILDENGDTVFRPGDFWIPYVKEGQYHLVVEEPAYILDPVWLQTPPEPFDPSAPSFVPSLDIDLVKGNFNVATPDIILSPYFGGDTIPAGTIFVY